MRLPRIPRRPVAERTAAASERPTDGGYPIAYDPQLVPPLALMREEGIDVLEEWFRWGEEWSVLLRVYAGLASDSRVLEIGCGLGRIAFPLRYVLTGGGTYNGFEIVRHKVDFLDTRFHAAYPGFHFHWADIFNSAYNPAGRLQAADYNFPFSDESFDLVYAASVFTHLLPPDSARYFHESGRVLAPGGRCLFSFFLLDSYDPRRPRASGFTDPLFAFDHRHGDHGDEFAVSSPEQPEATTAYRLSMIERFAADAGLTLLQPPLPGLWSGAGKNWIGAQDLLVLGRSPS